MILQHDLSSDLETCVVAPLVPLGQLPPMGRMRPMLAYADQEHVIAIDRLATVRRRSLSPPLGSAIGAEYEIKAGLDLLFSGF